MTKTQIIHYLSEHKQEFATQYGVTSIGLFGSYARDEAHEGSDIDIFVEMGAKFDNLMGLKFNIEDAFETKIDIVRLRESMNPYLKARILKDGINV